MKTARAIRESFLQFFARHGHAIVASSALVPQNDPTLFFTNAGMVQFKNVFLAEETREYTRAVTSQKCLRVAGKHNDLEEVGRTPRHHTLFEMLGNFSFGDYFKTEAIAYAWEFLTKECGIPQDRLVATVYEKDDEAEKLWTAHLPRMRIFRFGESDNFWSMGETGPCGPCSELHFDWHPEKGAPTKADVESGRFWEVWNLVFMQFNRAQDGTMSPLVKPSIDTGMGLERITAILQNQQSNYDTDLFAPIIQGIERITKKKYTHSDSSSDVSMRVIADHIRATTFLIADGVIPSNEGRGYVLRRIMRRAIRHGKMLGMEHPFFVDVAPIVIDEMGAAYPELARNRSFIETVIRGEEERFYQTLANGLAMLTDAFEQLRAEKKSEVPGDLAFKLYDTFGFPMDLTHDIAAENHFTVDHAGFTTCMEAQRHQARAAWKGSGEAKVSAVYQQLHTQGIRTQFVGFDHDDTRATILALVRDGAVVDSAGNGDAVEIITDRTPFYGESGGQVGDHGVMLGDAASIRVHDTRKPVPDIFVHHAQIDKGCVKVGDTLQLVIDTDRRTQIRKHHTATHLLHAALRQTLGDHVKQAGSLVTPDRLRFDFSHFAALTPDDCVTIEAQVNRVIQENIPVQIAEQPREQAIASGAMAFFGEKYGAVVRVVQVENFSTELCGGTHVRATGDIGALKIISESSVAAGVRRVEAVTGRAFLAHVHRIDRERREVAAVLKTSPAEIATSVARLQEQVKTLERELKQVRSRSGAADLDTQIETIGDVRVLSAVVAQVDVVALRELAEQYRQKIHPGIVALGTIHDDKASVIVMVSRELTARFRAGDLLQPICTALGGKGGGRPDMAQGGGPNVGALAGAMKELVGWVRGV